MSDIAKDIHTDHVLICDAEGPKLAHERDANDLLSAAFAHSATLVAIPVARLGDDFLRLNTRLAGDVVQKFANYKVRLAIVGDLSPQIAQSKALHDFVYEANRGQQLWFVKDMAELEARLAG
ncbi:DUF4180 domain-containing protein [Pseudorhodoplanes sinuspersici]|uniref:Alpha/beta hydrolase n=1 Tax=Pseudorhodoplanes sinuspersici TaxID=1235591 RepID=A0A1W7A039_9HYPH|nr:DUF4180 domain-containing protein [Pseudorhodoplanes sinuspersici]ARQ02953.1 alpha/beta hydrolase [Pseudorhodoplanes sinuspersici]